jgi:uncharacterized protein (DUF1778 family)
MSVEDKEKLVAMAAEIYGRYSSSFDMRSIEDRAREIVRDTYGPLLDPIKELVTLLELSPGDEIISVAIRGADGEIRIKPLE